MVPLHSNFAGEREKFDWSITSLVKATDRYKFKDYVCMVTTSIIRFTFYFDEIKAL